MITAYNPKVSDAASGKVGKEHQRKLSCVTTDIETSVIRSEIWQKGGMKKNEQNNGGKQIREFRRQLRKLKIGIQFE